MKEGSWVHLIGFILGISFLFSGCATINKQPAQSTEDLLMAAGFTVRVASTPEGEAKLKALKPLKIVKATREGKVIYVYPDPYNCKCAYVGGEPQYAEYRRLAAQRNIAEDDFAAAEFTEPTPVEPDWWR